MYMHIDTVETGSPGLKYPAPEDSGVQERGETSLHGLKYPAPEDSGVYTYRYSGNRFTWYQVSGTGGFYRSRSEGLTGSLRIIRHRRIGNTYLPCFICRVK